MRYISVCSGIEAATSAFHRLGWVPVAFSEIEPFPASVLAHHYPQVPNLGDMTKFHDWPNDLNPDLLVGGCPCQAFSVAGLREGLNDPRGNLTLTFMGVAAKYMPRWIVYENVPGILSDKTRALHSLLDGLEELGYVCDIEILDAQFHGLAQRRRRVFICAQRVESLLLANNDTSALTIAQCLIETLHAICIAASPQFASGAENLGCARLSLDGAKRRMKLFGVSTQPEVGWRRLLGALENAAVRCLSAQNNSVSQNGACGADSTPDDQSTDFRADSQYILTVPQWRQSLDAAFGVVKSFITSTSISSISDPEIYTCSKAVLSIGRLIALSNPSCPSFWSAGSSFLTAAQDFINYARQANSEVPEHLAGVHPWAHFAREAERASEFIADIGVECFGSFLPLSESLRGNSPPSREARQEIAGTLSSRAEGGGGLGTDFDLSGGLQASDSGGRMVADIAPTLNAHFGSKQGLEDQHINGGADYLSSAVAGTLSARDNKSARMDADTNHLIPMRRGGFFDGAIPILEPGARTGKSTTDIRDDMGIGSEGDPMFTLQSGKQHAVAFQADDYKKYSYKEVECATPLSTSADRSRAAPIVAFSSKDHGADAGEVSPTLRSCGHSGSHANGGGPPAGAFQTRIARNGRGQPEEICPTLNGSDAGATSDMRPVLLAHMQVRRLTPKECERLQGFPDLHTDVRHRNKPAADGPRYKALGNSMAVPCMAWIGKRIAAVEKARPPFIVEWSIPTSNPVLEVEF